MKCFNLLMIFLFSVQIFAQISDEKNLLGEIFLQRWNKILAATQEDVSVRISVSISSEKKSESGIRDSSQIPEIIINYWDESGFEIYQSNFSGESNFVIPSSFFNEIIPEANADFKNGKADAATEYILLNIREILYLQKRLLEFEESEISDTAVYSAETNAVPAAETSGETARNFNQMPYFAVIAALIVVFLFIIFRKKKKPHIENRSNLFNGMSKDGFFGGGFDSI